MIIAFWESIGTAAFTLFAGVGFLILKKSIRDD